MAMRAEQQARKTNDDMHDAEALTALATATYEFLKLAEGSAVKLRCTAGEYEIEAHSGRVIITNVKTGEDAVVLVGKPYI